MPVKINQNKNVNKLLSIISLPDQQLSTTITTTTTTETETTSSILLKRINGPTHISSAANILNINNPKQQQEYYSNYYYLGLLIIPFLILLLILILICSFGRTFQVYLYDTYSIILLPCFRPADNCNNTNLIEQTNETNYKLYDLTICYNEYDELWLNEQFMPQLTEFDRGYKIHKLMLYQRLNFHLSETCKRVLTSSKRVLLVFSEKFLNEEWNNKIFHEFIKHLYQTDLKCIIIIVNLSNINEYKSKLALNELKIKSNNSIISSKHNKSIKNNENNTFISRLRTHIKYSVGLNNIEYLNWTDYHFWKHLNYILPFKSLNQITKISKYSYDITSSCGGSSSSSSSSGSSSCEINKNKNKKNRISSIRSLSKKRSRKISEFNIPRTIAINTDEDNSNNNNNNNNNTNINSSSSLPSIKKIIVPIPNEMRTQLGSFNKTSLEQQKNEIFLTNSSKSMNTINSSIRSQQQQQQQQQPLQDKLFSKTRLQQQSDNQMTSNTDKKINKKNNDNKTNRYRRKSDTSSNNE
jgi:hypothetical protein